MSAELELYAKASKTRYAVHGAGAFGLTSLVVFGLSAWYAGATGHSQVDTFLAVGPLCGIVVGFAYGHRLGLSIVLAISFGLIGSMFILQEGRSPLLIDVVFTGAVSAFVFWIAGGCAVLTLPSELRFDGAKAFAIPGGLAGMAFQFLYGPAHSAFDLGKHSGLGESPWEYLVMWLIAGIGGGWLFGAELDRLYQPAERKAEIGKRNSWAVASVVCGILGLGIGMLYFLRYRLPLGLLDGISPASGAADWLWSWSLLGAVFATFALIQTFRNAEKQPGRSWAIVGIALAAALIFTSVRIVANPWKTRFNTNYAARLLGEHGDSGDSEHGNAIYTGNLILAQAALDNGDVANARRHLLEAATTTAVRNIEETGPDTSVARALLQRGERDTVLEYLHRCHNFWPQGAPVLNRWETALRAGRQPNFNNRTINAPDGSPPANDVRREP